MDPVTTTIRTVSDPAKLAAFVDGALSPEEAARMVLHLADCPGDRAYVDAMMEMNALLAAAYGDPIHQAIPERLRATIYPAAAVAPRARPAAARDTRAPARRPGNTAWAALAASAAIAFGLAAALAPGRDPAGSSSAGLAGPELRAALETSPGFAGIETADGAMITIMNSFFAGDGRPCREFEVLDAVLRTQGLACRGAGGGWTRRSRSRAVLPKPAVPASCRPLEKGRTSSTRRSSAWTPARSWNLPRWTRSSPSAGATDEPRERAA